MNETAFLDELISQAKPVTIRLMEGMDISAIPIAQDTNAIIVKRKKPAKTVTGETFTEMTSIIYKRAISVITPAGG